jgi:hypothetical protein
MCTNAAAVAVAANKEERQRKTLKIGCNGSTLMLSNKSHNSDNSLRYFRTSFRLFHMRAQTSMISSELRFRVAVEDLKNYNNNN